MEKWRPTRHEELHRIDLSRGDHRVRTKGGNDYGVCLVTLRYIREAGPDSTWSEPQIGLAVSLNGPFLQGSDLAEIPEWLQRLETAAQPMDP